MRYLLSMALVCLSLTTIAQIDRSKLPEPAPAKPIEIGDYEKFKLDNGLTVIVAENNKLPTISWTLSFNTNPILEGDKAGYSSIFGQVMRAGTTNMTKAELDEAIDFMGASIFVGSGSMSAFSLSKYKLDVLNLMTDMLYNPSFPEDEFERAIEQTLTGLKSQDDDPGAILGNVRGILNYGADHPFGEMVTEETVKNITMDDLKSHYNEIFKPNIAYLVVVGDISVKEVKDLTEEYFGDWKPAEVELDEFPAAKRVDKTKIYIVDRSSSVQSNLAISYPVENKPGNSDMAAISLMNQILGGSGLSTRLNSNLREDKGYTYGAYSSLGSSRYSATFNASAEVRNEVTDSAFVEIFSELNRMRNEKVDPDELELAKNYLRGSFARSLESRSTVAQFALNSELNDLPDDYYANYLKRIDEVTAEDIQRVAQKFIRPEKANVIIVGKAEEIAPKMKNQGEVVFLDTKGNLTDDPTKVVIADIDVNEIFDKYIEAIGGRDAVDAVETLQYKSSATLSMGGQSLDLQRNVFMKAPDKYLDLTILPMGEQRQVYNGGSGFMTVGPQKQPLEGAQLAPLKYLGTMFPERFYTDLGFEPTYKGIKKVDGKDAHRIDLNIDGFAVSEFYDVSTGLKIQADLGQNGKYTFTDYRAVDGVLIPFGLKVVQAALPVPLEFTVTEAMINEPIDDAKFD